MAPQLSDTNQIPPSPDSAVEATKELLRLERVSKAFGGRSVLRELNWTLSRGECAVILGPSGSGKSVFLSILLGFMPADSGEVSSPGLASHDLFSRVAVLFQDDALLDDRTVEANLAIALHERADILSGPFDDETNQAIDSALRDVGLDPARQRGSFPSALSGGMRRRAALARALIRSPEVLIADEPTSGLDPRTSEEIFELMAGLIASKPMSAIIITHDPGCAVRLGNPIYYFTPLAGELKRYPSEMMGASRPSREEILAWVENSRQHGTDASTKAENNGETSVAKKDPLAAWREGTVQALEAIGRSIFLIPRLGQPPSASLMIHNLRLYGIGSIGLTLIIFSLIGLVLEIQAERAITDLGFSNRLPELLALGLTRLAPILTGFLIAGRCGSAVTAQTGWMNLSGQHKALRTMRIDPDATFIPPLFWSWLIIVPVLTTLGMLTAWSSAWLLLQTRFSSAQITPRFFLSALPESLSLAMMFSAFLKSLLIGAGLAAIAYSGGISPKKSATDVARAITRGLVISFIWISVVDAVLSLFIPD